MGYDKETNAKQELGTPMARQLMKQFLKNPEGLGGDKAAYERGHIFSFDFTQEERDRVNLRMEVEGESFADAFDVMYLFILEARKK